MKYGQTLEKNLPYKSGTTMQSGSCNTATLATLPADQTLLLQNARVGMVTPSKEAFKLVSHDAVMDHQPWRQS